MDSRNDDSSLFSCLALLAIAGQIFFVASSFFLPSVSQLNVLHDRISQLALGRFGFIETAAFFVSGITTFALAFVIRQLTRHSPRSLLGSILIGIYGVGGIVVSIFPTNRINVLTGLATRTTTGTVHIVAAVVSFLCVTVGMFILSVTFRKDARWQSLSSWTQLCPIIALALLFVQLNNPLAGLMERLFISVVAIWLILVANSIRTIMISKHRTHGESTSNAIHTKEIPASSPM